jgi:phenylacetate-CoA ligase
MITRLIKLQRVLRNGLLNPDELQALQMRKLQETLLHAYQQVPYYSHLFDESGVHPCSITGLDDLGKIPVSTKNDLRKAGSENMIARTTCTGDLISARTSGTSGTPLNVFMTASERKLRRLIDFRGLLNAGFRPRDQLVTLGPKVPIRRGLHERLGLFRTDQIDNSLLPEEMLQQLAMLRPDILWVYPGIFRSLLANAGRDALREIMPRVLITSAETADPSLARKAWNKADVGYFNFYGSIETGRIAWECRAHDGLHVNTDHVLLELEPVKGLQTDESDGLGHVVVTTLNIRSMPFIRYRLGDLCSLVEGDCPCGSSFPRITAPTGREISIVKLPSGRYINSFKFSRVLRQYDWIGQFRTTQYGQGEFLVELVAEGTAGDMEVDHARCAIIQQLGEPADIDIRIVEQLTQSGSKFQDFIIAGGSRP